MIWKPVWYLFLETSNLEYNQELANLYVVWSKFGTYDVIIDASIASYFTNVYRLFRYVWTASKYLDAVGWNGLFEQQIWSQSSEINKQNFLYAMENDNTSRRAPFGLQLVLTHVISNTAYTVRYEHSVCWEHGDLGL